MSKWLRRATGHKIQILTLTICQPSVYTAIVANFSLFSFALIPWGRPMAYPGSLATMHSNITPDPTLSSNNLCYHCLISSSHHLCTLNHFLANLWPSALLPFRFNLFPAHQSDLSKVLNSCYSVTVFLQTLQCLPHTPVPTNIPFSISVNTG